MFITLEGPDGSGKTTQAQLLAEWLRARGHEVVLTREPGGGGPVAAEIRRLLLESGDMAPQTELFLFFAARAEHVAQVIGPALERGAYVVCDRYTDFTLAYQGYGLDVNLESIRTLHRLATGDLWPSATIVLDVAAETGLRRQDNPNRMEERGLEFAKRVRNGFLALAEAEPDRMHIVDASGTIEEVHRRILERLGPLL
jgi:dTMP kinase